MIALIIIGIILAILAIVLLLPLSLRLRYKETLTLSFEVLGLSFPLYAQGDTAPKDRRRKRKKKKQENATRQESGKKTAKKAKNKASPRSILHYVKLAGRILSRIYHHFPNCFTLRIRKFEVVIGGEDAAKAAINYGIVSQAAAYVLTLIETLFRVKVGRKSSLAITPNFLGEASNIALDIQLNTRPLFLLILALRAWGVFRILSQEIDQKQTKQAKEGV